MSSACVTAETTPPPVTTSTEVIPSDIHTETIYSEKLVEEICAFITAYREVSQKPSITAEQVSPKIMFFEVGQMITEVYDKIHNQQELSLEELIVFDTLVSLCVTKEEIFLIREYLFTCRYYPHRDPRIHARSVFRGTSLGPVPSTPAVLIH